MRKNKYYIKSLKKEWKISTSFEMLKWQEQLRFIWWIIRGNPRGIMFLVAQVKFGKSSQAAYDAAKQDKQIIVQTLINLGYYYDPSDTSC